MLRLGLKILVLVCAFALGYVAKPERVKIQNVPGPERIVMPVANRGIELSGGVHWLNVDAAVPIMSVADEQTMKAMSGYSGGGLIMGAYTPDQPAIYILGTWTCECETALHEYTHYLEDMIPDQAWRIRKAFHRLCSDKFRIDSTDLEPELPEPEGPGFRAP